MGGIDVAKDWHYVQWLDADGQPVGKAFRFANSRAGFAAMWARRSADAVRIGLESTGHYWSGLPPSDGPGPCIRVRLPRLPGRTSS